MKKRVLALTLAIMMLAAALPVLAQEATMDLPRDIMEHAAFQAIKTLISLEVINGYPDGTFQPDSTLTRAEAAKLMAVAGMLEGDVDTTFPDTVGHWAQGYIAQCAAAGIILGHEDGTFGPESPVTCQEFALMCGRLNAAAQHADQTDAPITRGDVAVMLLDTLQAPLAGGEKGASLFASLIVRETIRNAKSLQGFALAGSVTETHVNAVALGPYETIVYVWDQATGHWYGSTVDETDVLYNYVALYDTDHETDNLADVILVVNRQDGPAFWDAESMEGVEFAGPYSIPYGQRLLEEHGLGGAADDYSTIVTQGDLASSTYWPIYDWYNTSSTETLTYLTGFKTTLQTTGWACGTTSALMAIEWYHMRGDLNELDLSTLRDKVIDDQWRWGGYTDTQMLINMFTHLNTMAGREVWAWESTYDFVDENGEFDYDTYLSTDWIVGHLSAGHPILVGWNSFGGHWQVIIGYDTMGTEGTADDVLLLADPYDTTDHLNDGVNIQSYERLYWEWSQDFDRDFGLSEDYGMPVVFVPSPADGFEWQAISGSGLSVQEGQVWARTGNTSEDMVIPYGDTAADLEASEYVYSKEQRGENGLAGPASSDWYRKADATSPYYAGMDFYNYYDNADVRDSLRLLEHFQTAQQASEWTCGPASLRMALNYYGMDNLPSEFALAALREVDKEGATTLDGMIQMLEGLNSEGGDWTWLSTDDLDDDWNIEGTQQNLEGGFIPWCIRHGIPVVIGWDEWGGHWMVIIGFDDMGTEDTQDDVIILADPYDTTDHCQDGYVIESWERLLYGWGAAFDERGSEIFLAFGPQEHFEAMGLPVR